MTSWIGHRAAFVPAAAAYLMLPAWLVDVGLDRGDHDADDGDDGHRPEHMLDGDRAALVSRARRRASTPSMEGEQECDAVGS